jgi:hypothetical protein
MPIPATDVAKLDFLSLLVIGPVRVGKTTTCLSTGQSLGHWYVFCADAADRLRPASEVTSGFTYDEVNSSDGSRLLAQFELAMAECLKGIKEGRYQGAMFDTITSFSADLFAAETLAHEPSDTRGLYHDFKIKLESRVSRFAKLPCHKIMVAHDYRVAPTMQGQIEKTGPGILPNVEGGSRTAIPRLFQDVAYFEKDRNSDSRSFVFKIDGVFGPASSNAPGIERMPADIGKLWEHMKSRPKGVKIQTAMSQMTTKQATAIVAKPSAKPALATKAK